MSWRTLAIVILAGVSTSSAQPVSFPESAYLTPESVRDAVALGLKNDVVPYRFRQQVGHPPQPTAVVYTPFIRVALAAMMARRAGAHELEPSALPQWITASRVYVVFAAPCATKPPCVVGDEEFDDRIPLTFVRIGPLIGVAKGAPTPNHVEPTEIITDLAFLKMLGGLPFDRAQLAATFPPEAFRPGLTVYAQWTFPSGNRAYSGGFITDADTQSWR